MTGCVEPENSVPEENGEPVTYPVDWRVRIVTHLTKDVPSAYEGGPSHKAGALVVQSTPGKDAKGNRMGFATPSAVALALNLAIKAPEQALTLRADINESRAVSPFGPSTNVTLETTAELYDYFEHCMTSVTFSFQALEAYCNETISYKAPEQYALKRKKNEIHVDPDELERQASTDEKLAVVLPDLLGVETPRGGNLWGPYQALKELRDTTIHIKSRDFSPKVKRPEDLNEATLFVRLLQADVMSWPKASVALINYFDTDQVPRLWVDHVVRKLGIQSEKPKKSQGKESRPPRGKRK